MLELDGRSFVARIASELADVTTSVSLVGKPAVALTEGNPAPDRIQLPVVPDLFPNWGALGGVHAALANCTAEWALVVACDFPFVTTNLFARLASFRDNFDAVAPVQRDQIPQPLCALYRVAPCLRLAERMINSGERKPIALLQSVRTRWVTFSEIQDIDGAARFFDNINTPQDYHRISENRT